jgi:hypothetical protein
MKQTSTVGSGGFQQIPYGCSSAYGGLTCVSSTSTFNQGQNNFAGTQWLNAAGQVYTNYVWLSSPKPPYNYTNMFFHFNPYSSNGNSNTGANGQYGVGSAFWSHVRMLSEELHFECVSVYMESVDHLVREFQ